MPITYCYPSNYAPTASRHFPAPATRKAGGLSRQQQACRLRRPAPLRHLPLPAAASSVARPRDASRRLDSRPSLRQPRPWRGFATLPPAPPARLRRAPHAARPAAGAADLAAATFGRLRLLASARRRRRMRLNYVKLCLLGKC